MDGVVDGIMEGEVEGDSGEAHVVPRVSDFLCLLVLSLLFLIFEILDSRT